jgi:hypothetical protein
LNKFKFREFSKNFRKLNKMARFNFGHGGFPFEGMGGFGE